MSDEALAALVQDLAESSLFEGVPPLVLMRVIELGTVTTYGRNQFIFNEGDEGDRVYLIVDGAVRISRQVPGMGEEALAILKKGSAFGEMSLIDGSPRSADALAHEPCRLFEVDKDELESLMFVDRVLACDVLWRMVRILASRLRETNQKMLLLSITGRFE